MITNELFEEFFPNADNEWVEVLNNHLDDYDINTNERIAGFLSQCGVESAGWTKFEENLNYSADRMMQVWPKIFNKELALQCHRKPQLVANFAYANRMGNGTPESGDGWKYRGRGVIMLTGKLNYTAFAKDTFDDRWQDIVNNPDLLLEDKHVCLASALWYWDHLNCNAIAESRDIKRLTRVINGGTNGLSERETLFNNIMEFLS